jgi:hypothetical protein
VSGSWWSQNAGLSFSSPHPQSPLSLTSPEDLTDYGNIIGLLPSSSLSTYSSTSIPASAPKPWADFPNFPFLHTIQSGKNYDSWLREQEGRPSLSYGDMLYLGTNGQSSDLRLKDLNAWYVNVDAFGMLVMMAATSLSL